MSPYHIYPISLFLKSHVLHCSTLHMEDTKLNLRVKRQKNGLAAVKSLR